MYDDDDDPFHLDDDFEERPVLPGGPVACAVSGAPPGEVLEVLPQGVAVGDWLILNGRGAYEITNMFAPRADTSVKAVVLRGHPSLVLRTRSTIVRPHTTHRPPSRFR
ncbi:hypothetical protein [Streptomyces sp. NPDC048606]|uniref:hypothetical protein n=1 Tax=Streptomyces sp. NPDC048606 TaxID=3154726 RepID=UPI00342C737C